MFVCHALKKAYDKWVVDDKIYEHILEKSDQDVEDKRKAVAARCRGAMNTTATTQLEWKYFNSLLSMDQSEGQVEVTKAEREYSSNYRLRKEDLVHAVLLKKRNDFWPK